jgi:hypothetical protein
MRSLHVFTLIGLASIGGSFADLLAADVPDFLRDVKPILAQRCFRCHSSLEQESNLRLDGVPAILKGGDGGSVVVPGKSGDSRLIVAVEQRGDLKMPPEGEPLSAKQIAVLRAWIDAGAPAPPEGAEAKTDHWAFQKPVRPIVPTMVDSAWSANPIDAFVAARHAELKLTRVGEAPPNLLLRRLYIDLIGLPPTADELAEFLRKTDAYEEVVDRLLASPAYGERWGRHWMDVWRYSDWDGYREEVRESKPHIWRWRDWIVESLNADKPYDRMVQEMLAADELAADDPNTLRATGYLVRSWYKFNRNKWLDDAVEHTGKAFLGVTFNCARCHDHMYDPLEHREYYALRAFFEPYDIRTDRLPGESDTNKSGLARVFDAKAETPTFVFIRGNEKEPLKDQPVAPAVPKLLQSVPCSIEPVTLPQIVAYPGLADFVREETLAAAKKELEKAKTVFRTAEQKLAEAFSSSEQLPPIPDPRPPVPSAALHDADAQFALARAALAAAEAGLAFNEARLAADRANYAASPPAEAKELSLAAAAIERVFNRLQAEKGLLLAEINLLAAERAKKPDDAKTATAVTAAQTALNNAIKARADAAAALEAPAKDYSRLTPTYPATSTGRRLALARWITSNENPLAARVAINHIWLRHFGSPLVPTMFDFGLNGKPPTNPPLLDWLAVELMENGWRMKSVHKLIVMSRTYRLASAGSGQVQGSRFKVQSSTNDSTLNFELGTLNSCDPENLYYWRANPRRMEAEAVRDATLFLAGTLDLARGGPEVDQNQGLTVPRRSLYFRSSKEKKMEFLALFDSANPVECYRRSESIAPQQALALANSTLSLAQSRVLAQKLSESLGDMPAEEAAPRFVESAFVRILCRQPTADERAACLAFLREQSQTLADVASLTVFSAGPAASVQPSSDPQQRARESLVHVLFNHNDFVTVR